VANADLSGQVQITDANASSGWAVWAPDGSRLAFDSDRSDPIRTTTCRAFLTPNPMDEHQPDWQAVPPP
jgi:hypothetical protein